ncbi:hypothetical protein PM082_011820 [Marasmius tenuissimus]|nr:hypothetical protein PM082_011820 [Marasmius tenuissimus]
MRRLQSGPSTNLFSALDLDSRPKCTSPQLLSTTCYLGTLSNPLICLECRIAYYNNQAERSLPPSKL